uniref:Uncharacterized protein n=1 Tax=Cacopsylla melanoneura TaxID=428564 RepID=A0A8D8XT90_9HEMI
MNTSWCINPVFLTLNFILKNTTFQNTLTCLASSTLRGRLRMSSLFASISSSTASPPSSAPWYGHSFSTITRTIRLLPSGNKSFAGNGRNMPTSHEVDSS